MNTIRRITTGALTLALSLALTAAPLAALAHVFPQKQEPGAGTTVEAPAKVTITFDGPLEPAFSSLTVTNASGTQVNTAKSGIDAHQPNVESVALPALPAGKYIVHWVAVAPDGHRTHGDYAFNVK
ncbi:copper resistance protein CopC [Paraburkholderia sp. LEh10]|uniref:copper resistance CopC family protein n=1 Tax=Paraburkholderia sp. LEh10 TaxID=2821353 RepID=UPI001AE84822|nr:copper resistance CopC family protein [Paraburkholderia sp. LEh10]MBP0589598.1 copper resistance protein CopC [Paraburkholderia sp. LEh10]